MDGEPAGASLARAMAAALAVHYFPGMWAWDRSIVDPLVVAAYERGGGPPGGRRLLRPSGPGRPAVDHFTPVRVEADIEVPVPDPRRPGDDLSTATGQRVLYQDRIRLVLVDDQDQRCWLGDHRVVEDFADPDELALDERLLTACWAWEQIELHSPVVGVHHTELRLDGELRRTVVPCTTTEKRNAAARLGSSVRAMLDPSVSLEPSARVDALPRGAPSGLRACDGTGASDASGLLAERYRERPPDLLEEGRLGGTQLGPGPGRGPAALRPPRPTGRRRRRSGGERGDGGLADADAAVVRGDRVVDEDVSPACESASSTTSVRRTFWNTPPVRATVSSPRRPATAMASSAAARPIASWKPAATTAGGVPRSRSEPPGRRARTGRGGARRPRRRGPRSRCTRARRADRPSAPCASSSIAACAS